MGGISGGSTEKLSKRHMEALTADAVVRVRERWVEDMDNNKITHELKSALCAQGIPSREASALIARLRRKKDGRL